MVDPCSTGNEKNKVSKSKPVIKEKRENNYSFLLRIELWITTEIVTINNKQSCITKSDYEYKNQLKIPKG